MTALLAMLASCAAGVTVVGIDNGFGAATAVVRLLGTRPVPAAAEPIAEPGQLDEHRGPSWLTRPRPGPAPSPGSTASRASPGTWPWVRWSTPVPTWTRSAGCSSCCPSAAGASRPSPCCAAGIAATQVHVHVESSSVVRTAAHITGMVTEARLPDRVQRRALATFDALARAEGRLHRRPPESVHFHEVGGIDAIIDVVGTCAALEVLGIDEVDASAVAQGTGMVRAAHGLLPIPAPAVVELLAGAPSYQLDVPLELTTPTGAALLAALVTQWGPMPPITIGRTGFGAGSADLGERPNVAQVVIGTRSGELTTGQPVVLVEVNVDDATGETLAHAVGALLDAGAHDAWVTPIVMKKGRPAHTVSALADPALAGQVAGVLTAETGSMGVRGQRLERWPQAREMHAVEVEGLAVRVKVSAGRVKVEHDDAARVARRIGRPLREVVARAEQQWLTAHPSRAGDRSGRRCGPWTATSPSPRPSPGQPASRARTIPRSRATITITPTTPAEPRPVHAAATDDACGRHGLRRVRVLVVDVVDGGPRCGRRRREPAPPGER